MPQMDEQTTPAPSPAPKAPHSPETRKPKASAEKPSPELYTLTVDTANWRIVSVEGIGPSGERRTLTSEEKARLAKKQPQVPLRHIVEQAFEAGIEFVLGEPADPKTPEAKEDTELSGLVLQTLIEGSKAKELVKKDQLDGTVVGTLIAHAVASTGPTGR